ncbi:MAG: hypothetical protein E6K18_02120 [Methanobacteriota archaeon]|nr:MAG: hypothetical protein E6K18_02120 [Euryarchaeota archaeon]
MPSASYAVRSCRLEALLLLAVLSLAGVTFGYRSSPAPSAPPTIVWTAPANGTLQVPATAVIQVQFSAPMNQTTVNASTVFILPNVALNFTWPSASLLELRAQPALANCTAYAVYVTAGKDANGTDLAPGPVPNPWQFMTACTMPFIVSTSPADGARNVRPDSGIVVTFSRPMNCGPSGQLVRITFNPGLPPPALSSTQCLANKTVFVFTLTFGTRFEAGRTYSATVTGEDSNGSALVGGLVRNPWPFTVNSPPVVSKPVLDRTGCLDASTSVRISWTMSDNETAALDLTVRLWFADENGTQWTVTGPSQGFGPSSFYQWTLPRLNVVTQIQIDVNDSFGGGASNLSDPFRIDTGAPSVGNTFPANGARDVPTNTTITISFFEPMNESSVETAISALPSLLAPRFRWNPTSQAVTITTGGLLDNTTYAIRVAATARDTCGPGRAMSADYSFSFTTARSPPSAVSSVIIIQIDDSSVTLSWDPVTTFLSGIAIPPGARVVYRVTRSLNETASGEPLPDTTDTRITDRGLAAGTTYVYRVTAIVDDVFSTPSAPVTVRTTAAFLTSAAGALFLLVLGAGIVAMFLVGARLRRARKRAEADEALAAEIREIVEQIRRVRAEPDVKARRAAEDALQSHFRSMVEGGAEGDEASPDPRLEGLYRALAQALVQSPEVDVTHGRTVVEGRMGKLTETLRQQGASYRLLSEAEASVDSDLFRGLPQSARKALLLVYFYALEEYLSYRLRALVPQGATLLLGDRGHINVRRRSWVAQWNALTLGNLLYLLEHNAHFFVADESRWKAKAEPLLREAVEARNNTAHPSRPAPPLDRVRELVYRAVPLLEAILKKPPKATST